MPSTSVRQRSPLKAGQRYAGKSWARRGYVARADDRGRIGWAHYSDADGIGELGELSIRKRRFQAPVVKESPIQRRDPLQRVESLTKRLVAEVNRNPALFSAILMEIQGEYWKAGAPVSIEKLREVARVLLARAEQEQRAKKE